MVMVVSSVGIISRVRMLLKFRFRLSRVLLLRELMIELMWFRLRV